MENNNNPYNSYGGNYGTNYGYGNNYGNNYTNYGGNGYGGNYGGSYGGSYGGNYANQTQAPDDERSNFNIMEWLRRIMHYWYLFVVGSAIAFCCAYLQNRKWMPQYYSSGTIIIKESAGGASNLMQGFGVDPGYRNIQNQVVMLGSYDLCKRVVDSLPFLNVEYITQGRFKTRNIYHNTPILIEPDKTQPISYGCLFKCSFLSDGSLEVSTTDEDNPYSITFHYGETVSTPYFTATFWPTDRMTDRGHIFFRFRDTDGLINEFLTSMQLNYVTQGSTVLRIGLTSETPERDREFIDKLSDIYLLQNLERKNMVADNSVKFINEQLSQLEQNLVVSEGAMTEFRQRNKFIDVSSYAGQLMGRVASYDQEAMNMRLRETYMDYLINYLHQSIEEGTIMAPSTLGLEEPALAALTQQLNNLQIQRSQISEKNVYYAKYTTDIDNVKAAIEETIKSMRASLEIAKQDLAQRAAEVERDIRGLPDKELEMVSIERNYRIEDNYYTFFLQKRAEAEIQKASNMPDNDILDRARTTVVTNGKSKKKTMTTSMAIGLLIPLLLIILTELTNDKIRTPQELETLSHFRVLGTVRHAKTQNPTLVKSNPRSSYAEMLRAIRIRIEFIVQRKAGITIGITSTESGDGKTFLSSNLAALYAMTGKKTLLIDLDIRKPNIHTKLGLPEGNGVTNYIIGDCELDDVIDTNTPFDFDFIRAGTIPPNPGELTHSDKLANMLQTLRERYDYIIVDTSPIGQVPDAYSVVENTDLTLFVVRCLQTSKSACRQTLQQMEIDQEHRIHLVLSDIPTEGFHHGYGYGSMYGYGYGYGAGYGYGNYGYGYGYGQQNGYGYRRHYGLRYRYNKYYDKLFHREQQPEVHYYMDEEADS